jgi:dolichol kinase
MSFYSLAILGVIFIPVMFLSKNKNILTSIHHVSRKTYGEIYFPLSIVITALFFPIRYVFIYAILIMAISDGFASVVGQKYARKTYSILKSQKSYVGSFTFFALSLIIGIFVLYSLNIENTAISFLISFICAAILTIVEGALSYGLDNLLIPPLAALLLEIAVKTIK